MSNESSRPFSDPQSQNLSVSSELQPQKKSNWGVWIIIILGFVFSCAVCLCALPGIGAVVIVKNNLASYLANRAQVQSILDSYMRFMSAGDAESAHNLFSSWEQQKMPVSTFKDMIQGHDSVKYNRYKSLSVGSFNLTTNVYPVPNVPASTVAKVSGEMSYQDCLQREFDASLDKVDGKWQIDSIDISYQPSQSNQPLFEFMIKCHPV